ncbi:hypothetical protein [Couchioplanes azureus]|uniref:hypothetical protein n=1 Tax=Couchioplanes caeruleus TaxID=56438 RepID=UPI001670F656|nr:hypothetical protein [Couchioplanes caeruleus]GGQ56282.1 hypothetical protein GCM10010166_27180 [Couchioplanes caeruleus subsp. azureus]
MTEVNDGSAGLAERLIEATDWGSYRKLEGVSAADVGQALMSLLGADRGRIDTAEDSLEDKIVPQADLYSAAEPAISVLAASLADPRPRWVRIAVLELMYLILSGAPVRDEVERGNGALLERCIARVRESLWLIVREALADETCYEAALDVLDMVDPGGAANEILRSIR